MVWKLYGMPYWKAKKPQHTCTWKRQDTRDKQAWRCKAEGEAFHMDKREVPTVRYLAPLEVDGPEGRSCGPRWERLE